MTKKDRVDKGHTTGGISRRTDRAVRRAARASGRAVSASGAVPAGPDYPRAGESVTRTMVEGEAELSYPLAVMLFGEDGRMGRVLVARKFMGPTGSVVFEIPEQFMHITEWVLETWWDRFMIDSDQVVTETWQESAVNGRSRRAIYFELQEGRQDG